uniref:Glycosyltransferase family 92 protein n=1 Tax=Stegastes partitus TaxID=144197 RepID=A0A3B5B487_9TELE
MEKAKGFKGNLFFLFIATFIFIFILSLKTPRTYRSTPQPRWAPTPATCPLVSNTTITPLQNTQHFLVSAYMDQRVDGLDVRIIGIFRRDSIQPLQCFFNCGSRCNNSAFLTSPTTVLQHSDNFGFPFVTTDAMCSIPKDCHPTHVTLLTQPHTLRGSDLSWLPIRNQKTNGKETRFKFNFTVCVSNLFGDYNNVLQVAQALEMYRSAQQHGPELSRLLHSYSQEGFLEIVSWPIDKHLNPSRGWLFSQFGGDLHYFGQLTTLNECIYRSMERSRYVLLNDIDEIIMPYQHNDLMSMMNTLQRQQPNTGVFLIENHIFPKKHFEPSGRFHLPQWNGVPGVNILEHVYREDPDRNIYHPHKMIVQPRMVEQTSVHEVLKHFGERYKVPLEVCRIIHVRVALRGPLPLEQLHEDKRLWDFHEKLIPNVDGALQRAGLLRSERES